MSQFFNVIQFSKIDDCLQKARDLLTDTGLLYVKVNSSENNPNTEVPRADEDTIEYKPNKFYTKTKESKYYYNYFTKDELAEIIKKNEFRILFSRTEEQINDFSGRGKVTCSIIFILDKV